MRFSAHFCAYLLLISVASNAHADWVNAYSFDVAVGSSTSGPYAPAVEVWSSSAPTGLTPSSILLTAETYPQAYSTPIAEGVVHPLGIAGVFLGNADQHLAGISKSPFAFRLTLHDKASGSSDNVYFNGEFNLTGPYQATPTFAGHAIRKVGDSYYEITALPPMPAPMMAGAPVGPNDPKVIIDAFEFDVAISRTDVAPTPEPATLLLSVPAVLAIGVLGSWRKRQG